MKHLQNYLDNQNFRAKLFGHKLYDINTLTQTEVDDLCQRIDSDLSPENLSCDGELPRNQVNAKYRGLVGAVRDLHSLGFTITLTEI